MLDSLKAGQNIKVTITKVPRNEAGVDTLERLMRADPSIKRGLKRTQRRRRQQMVVYNRGNRDWYKREKCPDLLRVAAGESWTMPFSHQIAPDLRSVESYISIKNA